MSTSIIETASPSDLNAAIAAHERAQRLNELLTLPGVVEGVMERLAYYDRFLSEVYPITIDYGSPKDDGERANIFKGMVTAGGYDWVNSDITPANFTLSGTGIVEAEICLFHFDRTIQSEPAMAEMPKFGYQPPKMEHCLAFGSQHPEVQRKFPVVFLGSSCLVSGYRYVPCLCRDGSGRSLRLYYFGGVWYDGCRFAAVRTKKN